MVKVIITDVDGTLLNSNKEILENTKNDLIKAQGLGIRLVLASGRPTAALTGLARELHMDKHNGLLIAYNGSKIIDCSNGEVLYNKPMNKDNVRLALEHLKKFNVIPMVDVEDSLYVNDVFHNIFVDKKEFNVIKYESRSGGFRLCEIDDLPSFVDFPINKILISGNPEYLKENFSKITEPFNKVFNIALTTPFYLEFNAKNVDKLEAIKSTLEPMGYTNDEIIAFGDGGNDIAMINYAGFGVAMDNAMDELKNVAKFITYSNDLDGISYALRKYIPELNE